MKHLFFDLDGTLVDSSRGVVNGFTVTLTKLGIAVPDEKTLKTFIGPPLETSLSSFGNQDFVNKAIDIYREFYQEIGIRQVSLYKDIVKMLDTLQQNEYVLYIATSKNQVMAIDMLENLGISKYFKGIFGSLGNDHKADVIGRGLNSYDLAKEETYMIGDTRFDMIGGKKIGLKTIGVTWGFGSEESLRSSGADRIIHSPLELIKRLETF